MNIHVKDFLAVTRLVYVIEEGRLLIEERPLHWRTFLIGMHLRRGLASFGWFLLAL